MKKMWNQKMRKKVIGLDAIKVSIKVSNDLHPQNVSFTDPKVLLIGSNGYLEGKSEVLSLPDLTPLDCNIPVFPSGLYRGYAGRSTSDGILMCGGETDKFSTNITSSCYLLTSSGYQDMPGIINNRSGATSVVTPLGLWITGKPGVISIIDDYFFCQEEVVRITSGLILQRYGTTTSPGHM